MADEAGWLALLGLVAAAGFIVYLLWPKPAAKPITVLNVMLS